MSKKTQEPRMFIQVAVVEEEEVVEVSEESQCNNSSIYS